ncbi:Anaphase-promoting complex subunit 8 [Coemansia sp. Cherry 401B]|nr:Anaphase-promoting complex subunit 8 [Coemansia sp. Cherry 401B]
MDVEATRVRDQLRQAVDECSARGLAFAAKWAAEQLCSLPADDSPTKPPIPPTTDPAPASDKQQLWARRDADERDRVSLAKCLFDLREFDRVAFTLQECVGPRALFLRLYAQYLSRERRAGESALSGKDTDNVAVVSADDSERRRVAGEADRALLAIRDELETLDGAQDADAFLLYLLAMAHDALGQRAQARAVLLRSVGQYAYNWSAWQLLETCVDAREPVERLGAGLAHGWMRHAFLAQALVEQMGSDTGHGFAAHVRVLEQLLPNSPFVLRLRALRHYSLREFDEAAQTFAQLQRRDPYALELSDILSNILYVLEDRARLGELARRCAALDRFRPETCCVIGNYYSLRREHEKAVGYFQRALQLDRRYLAAWTLMGHEFIEMKNTSAAVDAYRHAVDVDERDYRAWYGLGQTYEMLNMPHYACSYYARAAALRPYDSRMWCALGSCHEASGQRRAAIDSFRRALLGSAENEAMAVARLARLHDDAGDRARAAYYYQLLVEHAVKNGGLSEQAPANPPAALHAGSQMDELAAACLFLASFEHDRGNTHTAQRYLAQIVDGASSAGVSQLRVDEATAMMRAMSPKDISAE